MRGAGGTRTCWRQCATMTSTIGMAPSFTISPARGCTARRRDRARVAARTASMARAAQSQVLAVYDVHDVIVPAIHFGFDEVFADVKVERQQWMIAQHEALGALQQVATSGRVGLYGSGANQRVVFCVSVPRQIDAEVAALEVLSEGVGIVVVSHPTRAKDLDVAAIDVLQQ